MTFGIDGKDCGVNVIDGHRGVGRLQRKKMRYSLPLENTPVDWKVSMTFWNSPKSCYSLISTRL